MNYSDIVRRPMLTNAPENDHVGIIAASRSSSPDFQSQKPETSRFIHSLRAQALFSGPHRRGKGPRTAKAQILDIQVSHIVPHKLKSDTQVDISSWLEMCWGTDTVRNPGRRLEDKR